MCTASWSIRPTGGYEFWFSRDEQRSRATAEPPAIRERSGISWIAPKDPDGGGTWIAVNETGLTLALLNAYDLGTDFKAGDALISRGLLIHELAAARDLGEVGERLENMVRAGARAPFHLIACPSSGAMRTWTWDGAGLTPPRLPREAMLTTSSYRSSTVVAARRERYAKRQSARHFHEAPDQQADPFTVRMSRDDARTVSLTKIEVGAEQIVMAYAERREDAGFHPMKEMSISTRTPAR